MIYALIATGLELWQVRGAELDPDVITYLAIADGWSWDVLWSGAREPVWPTLFALPVSIVGAHPFVARTIGVAGFLFLVGAAQFVATRLVGRWLGLAVSSAVAASPWMISFAVRGLREQTAAAGVILVTWSATQITGRGDHTLWTVATFGAAGLLMLLRWDTMLLVLPILVLTLVVRRPGKRTVALALLVLVLIVSPLMVGNALRYGDPLFHSNIHAVFFRNLEFHDQPGFISKEEFERDAYSGGPETWFHYIFGRHTTRELVEISALGAANTALKVTAMGLFYPEVDVTLEFPTLRVFRSLDVLLPWALLSAAAVGAVALLRRFPGDGWQFGLVLPLSIGQHAPIALIFDPRLAMTVFPVTLLVAAVAIRAFGGSGEAAGRGESDARWHDLPDVRVGRG